MFYIISDGFLPSQTNPTMAKRIISVSVALIVAFIIIMGFEMLGGIIFKTAFDPKDGKSVSDMMVSMPIAAFLWLLLGYGIAAFLGGLVATFIWGRTKAQPALIVGAFLTVGGIMNFISVPGHPVWFIVVNVPEYVPLAWLGYFAVKQKEEAV
jgi:hypothetical protein